MADVEFTPAFVQNVQAMYAHTFDAAVKLGFGAIGLEIGTKVIYFAYDRLKNLWKPIKIETNDPEAVIAAAHDQAQQQVPPQLEFSSTGSERRFAFENIANTAPQFDDAMAEVKTPEALQQQQQQQQQQTAQPQPRPQQPTALEQRQRIEAG